MGEVAIGFLTGGNHVIGRTAYALAALVIFFIEVFIALFIKDSLIRPYIGDALAVALVYTSLRAVTPLSLWPAIILTLAIALVIELGQLFDIAAALGLGGNQLARIVLGGAFDPMDFAAYGAGALLVVAVEVWQKRAS